MVEPLAHPVIQPATVSLALDDGTLCTIYGFTNCIESDGYLFVVTYDLPPVFAESLTAQGAHDEEIAVRVPVGSVTIGDEIDTVDAPPSYLRRVQEFARRAECDE